MNILGVETSLSTGTVALVADGAPKAEMVVSSDMSHSTRLPQRVDELLNEAGLTMGEIGLIAVGVGPGSFTGIRVGVAFAKGVRTALGTPVVGVSTFDIAVGRLARSHAHTLATAETVAVVLDARRGEFYCRIYRKYAGGHRPEGADAIVPAKAVADMAFTGTLIAGPDIEALLQKEGIDPASGGIRFMDVRPDASAAALIAEGLSDAARERCADLTPLYIRRTQAEEKHGQKT
ncbi:MAG TPA: tRNA (adenosine(37)-N6)-threonylcarbamoyltransferase complex dimerization subunit type 1 TsaB [bacterium]|nr:tRNA (adenosine(37)-N6)-threonylcarbamoyltransferase complex dimerization subunit type 1 TsaB [bacterium]